MNILKEVLSREVFPALGCTEPIAVALAAAVAGAEIEGEPEDVRIIVDPGVYKNGLAVTIPNTNGERGNLVAGALGALIRRPDLRMEILSAVEPRMIAQAKDLIQRKRASIIYDPDRTELYIEVRVASDRGQTRAVVAGGHTNLVLLEKNGVTLFQQDEPGRGEEAQAYRRHLKESNVSDLIDLVEAMDEEDLSAIRLGVEMNMEA